MITTGVLCCLTNALPLYNSELSLAALFNISIIVVVDMPIDVSKD